MKNILHSKNYIPIVILHYTTRHKNDNPNNFDLAGNLHLSDNTGFTTKRWELTPITRQ